MKYTQLSINRDLEGNLCTTYVDLPYERKDTEKGNFNVGYSIGDYCYPTEFGKEKALKLLKEEMIRKMKEEISWIESKIKEVESL